jgi:hypothetical protein
MRLVFLCALMLAHPRSGLAQQSANSLVEKTLKNEAAVPHEAEQIFYVSQERSTRTGGHLWTQRVAQIKGGFLRRLVAIDGVPLTAEQAQKENQRIAKLVAHPEAFRKAHAEHRDSDDMIGVMARAFVFTYEAKGGECTRIHFAPNPAFKPASYQERLLHTLEGTVWIQEPEGRVCEVSGKVSRTVEIGYGLLGRLEQGGQVHLVRSKAGGAAWQVTTLNIHLVGKVLMVKDMSQNNDETRSEFRDLPPDVTLAQAAELTK